MFALPSAALLGLALSATPATTSARVPSPTCEPGVRRLELTANAANERLTVCIHPGLITSLIFDSKLARVELEGRRRFRVQEGDDGLTLLPSEALEDGERVPMTVYFQDGAAPASATFELVVHPSQAEGQVMVTRQPRTLASYREGERQARAEARQCREEKARLQAECVGQEGLTGLLLKGLLGERGIASRFLSHDVTSRSGNTLTSTVTRSYRSDTGRMEGGQQVVRLAVELMLWNKGETPWTPGGAVLMGLGGPAELKVLGVWPREPIPSGERRHVVVEVEATENEARGTFTLKLWGQEGSARGELLDGVTFP